MARAKPKPPPQDEVEFFDVEQRGDDWHELRRGVVTASKLATVIASGKDGGPSLTREKYMKLLAGEIISGQVAETFRNEAMERGTKMEPEARAWYARTRFTNLEPVGFVRRTIRVPLGGDFAVGCSPDSKVSPTKGMEIKSMAPHLLVDVKLRGAAGFPAEHRAQLQGTMLVTGWREMDLVLFYTGWPDPPVFTVARDEAYIKMLSQETEKFCFELRRLVDQVRGGR